MEESKGGAPLTGTGPHGFDNAAGNEGMPIYINEYLQVRHVEPHSFDFWVSRVPLLSNCRPAVRIVIQLGSAWSLPVPRLPIP